MDPTHKNAVVRGTWQCLLVRSTCVAEKVFLRFQAQKQSSLARVKMTALYPPAASPSGSETDGSNHIRITGFIPGNH